MRIINIFYKNNNLVAYNILALVVMIIIFTYYEDMKEIYESIGALQILTFYIYGNHDRQNKAYKVGRIKFDVKELEKVIKDNGITILKDEWQYVSSGFSGWVLPFRNEEHCNYEVINLRNN